MALDRLGRVIPDAPTTGWRVEAQDPSTEIDASGRVQRGVRVSFVTGTGQRGSVFVADAQYNPTNVRAVVAAAASAMDEVAGLTG